MLDNHYPRFLLTSHPQCHIMAVEYLFTNFMIRPLDANNNFPKSMSFQGIDSATANRAKTEDDGFALVTIMPINSFQLQCVDHCAVTGHLIIFIEGVSANLALWPPNIHVFKSNECLFSVDGYLGNLPLLGAMGITPQDTSFTKLFKISKHGLGDYHHIHVLQ